MSNASPRRSAHHSQSDTRRLGRTYPGKQKGTPTVNPHARRRQRKLFGSRRLLPRAYSSSDNASRKLELTFPCRTRACNPPSMAKPFCSSTDGAACNVAICSRITSKSRGNAQFEENTFQPRPSQRRSVSSNVCNRYAESDPDAEASGKTRSAIITARRSAKIFPLPCKIHSHITAFFNIRVPKTGKVCHVFDPGAHTGRVEAKDGNIIKSQHSNIESKHQLKAHCAII